MSPDAKDKRSIDERMQVLERKAKIVRSRLLRAVDALDARRHQVVKIGSQAKRLAVPAALSVVGIGLLLGASVLFFAKAVKVRRQRSVSYRLRQRIQSLDLVGRPSLSRRVLEKVALTLVTMATSELGRRMSKNFLDGRLPSGRLPIGRSDGQSRVQGDILRP